MKTIDPKAPRRETDVAAFLSAVLARVSKPGRYIGGEINSRRGFPGPGDVRVCLAFPEVYEIGMSHQGIAVLLSILNATEGVFAERAFAVWPDMEEEMRRAGIPLFSLETKSPLSDFDIVGFSLGYELTYTNVVRMMELAGIPLFAAERREGSPLVIAGGVCAFNPEPVAELFDAIVVGDGEEAIVEVVRAYRECRGEPQAELLGRLGGLDGVYVPRFYEPRYVDGRFAGMTCAGGRGGAVKKRVVTDLNRATCPTRPIVPHVRAVHDRVGVEIARGCARGCRFCQAGFVYRPIRERDEETLCSLVDQEVRTTGMEEVSLLSLSSGDYSAIGPLMAGLARSLSEKKVALSVPSLRVDTLTDEMIREIRRIRKTGFTVAPEAGSARLRAVINKDVTDAEIDATVERVFGAGWRLIKLYFMIGLPTETDDDLQETVALIQRIERKLRSARWGAMNVSLSTFVPKPHTPFQWEAAIGMDETRRRQAIIRGALRSRRVDIKSHDARMSYLEAVFSRGDRRLLAAIVAAARKGCRFDGWTEHFRFDLWEEAFSESGLSMSAYAERAFGEDDPLPWDHIDARVTRSFLAAERGRAYAGDATKSCLTDACTDCGVCGDGIANVRARASKPPTGGEAAPRAPHPSREAPARLRHLVLYSRRGPIRFLSHLEVASLISRALMRADVPVNFTEGFHPKPRISFAEALPVGVEAAGEPFFVELSRNVDCERVAASLNETLPEGIRIESIFGPGGRSDAIAGALVRPVYEVIVTEDGYGETDVPGCIASFLSEGEGWFAGVVKGKEKRIDVRPFVETIEFAPEKKAIRLVMQKINGSSPSPYRVLATVLGVPEIVAKSFRVVKESALGERGPDRGRPV